MNRHGVPTLLARQIPACSWHRIPASYRICNICPYALSWTPIGSRNTATSKRRHPLWRTVRPRVSADLAPISLLLMEQCFGGRVPDWSLHESCEFRDEHDDDDDDDEGFWRTLADSWCGIEIENLGLFVNIVIFLLEVAGTIVDAILGSLYPHCFVRCSWVFRLSILCFMWIFLKMNLAMMYMLMFILN